MDVFKWWLPSQSPPAPHGLEATWLQHLYGHGSDPVCPHASLPSHGLSPCTAAGEGPQHGECAFTTRATGGFSHQQRLGPDGQIQHRAGRQRVAGAAGMGGRGCPCSNTVGTAGWSVPLLRRQDMPDHGSPRWLGPVTALPAPLDQMGAEGLPGSL